MLIRIIFVCFFFALAKFNAHGFTCHSFDIEQERTQAPTTMQKQIIMNEKKMTENLSKTETDANKHIKMMNALLCSRDTFKIY